MEEDNAFNKDECCYSSYFEDDLEYVLRVQDILDRACGSHEATFSSTFKDTYFHSLNFESDLGYDEDMKEMFERDGG